MEVSRGLENVSRLGKTLQNLESDCEDIIKSPLGLALQFYYDALMANYRRRLELAVVNFVMVAESLLIEDYESIRQKVSRWISALISDTKQERDDNYRKMKKLYGLGSGIVHGGGKKATPHDVQALYTFLKKSLLERISLRHLSKHDFVEKLDEIFKNWDLKEEFVSDEI